MFGVDSSSSFHVRVQTNRQTDTTERPTHAGGYAGVGNNITWRAMKRVQKRSVRASGSDARWKTTGRYNLSAVDQRLRQGRVFRLPSEPTLRRSHTAVRQMATRNVANVLLLRNRIKLTLTITLTLNDTVTVLFFTLISLTPIEWLYRHNKRNYLRGAIAGFVGGPVFSRLCESGANVCSLGSRKTTPSVPLASVECYCT